MKTWKHFTFVVVLTIFGIVGFIGCDNGNEDADTGTVPVELRGTWVSSNRSYWSFQFTSNSFTWIASNVDSSFTVNVLSSITDSNINPDTNVEYPSGYKLSGKILSTTGTSYDYQVGDDYSLSVYFNASKNKFMNNSLGASSHFEKQ